jgi:hypothetical protein
MASNRSGRAAGLLVEGLVILVSILAAFFLEGWRDDRELNREVVQELSNVQRELERNRDLVTAQVAALSRVISATRSVLALLDASSGATAVQVQDTLVYLSTGWSPSLDPSLGALEALITSGRLSQIDDPELRLQLAGVRDLLSDAMEEEATAREISLAQLFPLVRSELDFSATIRVRTEFFESQNALGLSPQERARGRAFPSYRAVDYPNSAAIRNTLVLKLAWLGAGVSDYSQVLQYIDDLSGRLARELDRR